MALSFRTSNFCCAPRICRCSVERFSSRTALAFLSGAMAWVGGWSRGWKSRQVGHPWPSPEMSRRLEVTRVTGWPDILQLWQLAPLLSLPATRGWRRQNELKIAEPEPYCGWKIREVVSSKPSYFYDVSCFFLFSEFQVEATDSQLPDNQLRRVWSCVATEWHRDASLIFCGWNSAAEFLFVLQRKYHFRLSNLLTVACARIFVS